MADPIYPIQGKTYDRNRITSHYGDRQVNTGYSGVPSTHLGMDDAVPEGTPILAPEDGVISAVHAWSGSKSEPYGNYIDITTPSGRTYRFAHMADVGVQRGARVRQGQVVGRVGKTGNATGSHLHMEVMDNGPSGPMRSNPLAVFRNAKTGGPSMATSDQTPQAPPDYKKLLNEHLVTLKGQVDALQKQIDALNDEGMPPQLTAPLVAQVVNLQQEYTRTLQQVSSLDRTEKSESQNPPKVEYFTNEKGERLPHIWNAEAGEFQPFGNAQPSAVLTAKVNGVTFLSRDQGATWSAASGLPADYQAPERTTIGGQVFERNPSNGRWQAAAGLPSINTPTSTATVNGQVFERDAAGNWAAAKGLPAGASPTVTREGRVYPTDRTTGLPIKEQGVDLRDEQEIELSTLKAQAEMAAARYTTDKASLVADVKAKIASGELTAVQAENQLNQFEELWSAEARRMKQQEIRLRSDLLAKQSGYQHDPLTGERLTDPNTGQPLPTADESFRQSGRALEVERIKGERLNQAAQIGSNIALETAFRGTGTPGSTYQSLPMPQVQGDPSEPVGVRVMRQLGLWNVSLTPQMAAASAPQTAAPMPAAAPPAPPTPLPMAPPPFGTMGPSVQAPPQESRMRVPAFTMAA